MKRARSRPNLASFRRLEGPRKRKHKWHLGGGGCSCGPDGHIGGAGLKGKVLRKLDKDTVYTTGTNGKSKSRKRQGSLWDIRAGKYRCHYCGGLAMTVDHVVPASQGGTLRVENVVPSCDGCNHLKGSHPYEDFIDMLEFGLRRTVVANGWGSIDLAYLRAKRDSQKK